MVGLTILIKAQDDTHVASVQVKIDDDQGNFIEAGEAVRPKGVWWTFITTSQVPQTPAPGVA